MLRPSSRRTTVQWLLALGLIGAPARQSAANDAGATEFDRKVAPILARRCLSCHSGAAPKGKLDLSRKSSAVKGGESGPPIEPRKPEESLLWERVASGEMPPKKPLSAEEKAILKEWIAAGSTWGTDPIDPYAVTTERRAGRDWWAFQPLVQATVPLAGQSMGLASPIDAFVVERQSEHALTMSPPADRRTLIRRLSYDLLGLPPSPERVEAFERDRRPDAYERLVDELLASPHFGVRWARLWLDLARFGESNGFEFDEFRPWAWPYRDWVAGAFNRNMAYDEFVRLQLAGDALDPDDPSAVEATGFLVAGAYDSAGQKQQSLAMRQVVRQDELEDIISTVGQTFLGLTIHCARCHDHKFDPIPQTEYYRLAAALVGVRHGERDLSVLDPAALAARRRIRNDLAKIDALEAPIRIKLAPAARAVARPAPFARWDFDTSTDDRAGRLDIALHGAARLSQGGLSVDGQTGFALSSPLTKDITAKTLEAWVHLDNLTQQGGGVIGLMHENGELSDAIGFGEFESKRWMAGSDNFSRTQSFMAGPEPDADARSVHVAIVYGADGTVSGYRDGRPLGKQFKTSPPPTFRAGESRVVFGMRHGLAPGGNRMLFGTILRARLYDRALTPEEIAASAAGPASVDTQAVVAKLTPSERAERSTLIAEMERERKAIALRVRRSYAVKPAAATVEPTHVLISGNTKNQGAVVAAGGIGAAVGLSADFGLPLDAAEGARRVRLAKWITDPKNPLTPRVIVNRIWQAHFGTGLVETPSDLGFNGGRPSHPALLDWLAVELASGGWDLKRLHRSIVVSQAYRQSSLLNSAGQGRDASNRLLWRKAPVRLEAEMVRDAMLAVSGALDTRLGGPGFKEFSIEQAPGTPAILYVATESPGAATFRRTLYRTWARGGRSGFLDVFDCPDPSTVAPRRTSTTTPLQALTLLNSALSLSLAGQFARRLEHDASNDPVKQVDRAYLLAFGRLPRDDERSAAANVVARHGAAALARAIFNSSEFLYVD
jgi:hypothetical protein